jgi:hypothetical protein
MSLLKFCFDWKVMRFAESETCDGQAYNVPEAVGIYKGDLPTKPKNQTKYGQGNSPEFQTSITNTYWNIRLEPSQFANGFNLLEGMWITESFGLKRTFKIVKTIGIYRPSCFKIWYYKVQCTEQTTPAYDTE